MRTVAIRGWGMYTPQRVVTNAELARSVDTSDEWIASRTGIRQRRIAGPEETTSSMGLQAARNAIQTAGLTPSDIDLVIVGTATPDYPFPATACLIQDALGITGGAFDLEAGCTSFMYGLSIASAYIAAGMYDHILVVGSEVLSRILDWTDRSTCVLFGDGAGAVVVSSDERATFQPRYVLGSDGSGAQALSLPAGGSRLPAGEETVRAGLHFVHMAGPEVFRFATRVVVESTQHVLAKAGLSTADVDLFIPHQANTRIIDYAVHRLGIPDDRVFVNIDNYGNTSSASIPIALCEAQAQGRLQPDDIVVMVGFGAGLTWAAAALQWTGSPLGLAEVPGERAAVTVR
jgi:3-oxoacyl-[acyl-carrier-protein] synthase III